MSAARVHGATAAVALLVCALAVGTEGVPVVSRLTSLMYEEYESLQSDARCFVCTRTITYLAGLARGVAEEDIHELLAPGSPLHEGTTSFCVAHPLPGQCTGEEQCQYMCTGLVNVFIRSYVELARNSTDDSDVIARLFCTGLDYCSTQLSSDDVAFANKIFREMDDLASQPPSPITPHRPSTPYAFAQLTDVHLDVGYVAGSEAECGLSLCCHPTPNAHPSFPAGKWGELSCDAPMVLLKSALDAMEAQHLDFLLWTGDTPPHNVWEQSRDYNTNVTQITTTAITEHMPHTPVFPCIGNHEIFPVDMFHSDPKDDEWLYHDLAEMWKHWLPSDAVATLGKYGYYSALAKPGLRILSLNTNHWIRRWWYNPRVFPDVGRHMMWLYGELSKAEKAGEKVIIIGHMAPGDASESTHHAQVYHMLSTAFSHVIVGQFFGHTHIDSFRLFLDVPYAEKAVSVMHVGPALTPYGGINPSFRVYDGDATTFKVVDYRQYRLELAKQNALSPQHPAVWEVAYRALEEYDMASFEPSEWFALASRIKSDDAVFAKYAHNYMAGLPDKTPRMDMVCEAIGAMPSIRDACLVSAFGPGHVAHTNHVG